MKKQLLFFAVLIVIATTCHSQINYTWAKAMGTTNSEIAGSVAVDATGNVYTTGTFLGTIDLDPGIGTFTLNASTWNVYVSKLDAAGNFVWGKQVASGYWGDTDLDLDVASNLYITGSFNGTVDFDPSASVSSLAASGSNADVFIWKLDVSGNFVWAKKFTGAGGEIVKAIDVDFNGDILTTGTFSTVVDFDPSASVYTITPLPANSPCTFITKLNGAGNFIWAKFIGPYSPSANSITTDDFGNVYTTGFFNGGIDFDPGAGTFNLNAGVGGSLFISKLDALGNFVWAKEFLQSPATASGASNNAYSIAVDKSGNVLTTGTFTGTVDFDPGVGTNYLGTSSPRVFVSKLDALGNFIWAQSIGSNNAIGIGQDIAVDDLKNVYLTGQFATSSFAFDFDPALSTSYTLTSNGTNSDIFIERLDSTGSFNWAKTIGSVGVDVGNSIAIDGNHNVYATGTFSGTADFDPNAGVYNIPTNGGADIFIEKFCQTPNKPLIILGNSNLCFGALATYSVASVLGASSYSWILPSGWTGSSSSNSISPTSCSVSGNITVTAIDACGSSSPQILSVTVNALPIILVNSGSICIGDSFTMSPTGASTYTYSGGNPIVTPTTTSSYSVSGTSTAGCVSNSPAISNVIVNPLPIITVSTTNSISCSGSIVTLTANGANTYVWDVIYPGNPFVDDPFTTTTYTVYGTDVNGCSNTSVFTQSVSTCTGIAAIKYNLEDVTLYPNPIKDILKVSGNNMKKISITNNLGQSINTIEVNNQIEININLEDVLPGIYFVNITDESKNVSVKKIIKE